MDSREHAKTQRFVWWADLELLSKSQYLWYLFRGDKSETNTNILKKYKAEMPRYQSTVNWTNMLQYLFCQLTRILALILVGRIWVSAYSAALNQYISNKMLIWIFDMLQGLNANVGRILYSSHTSEAVSTPTVHTSDHILYTSHLHFRYRRKGQMCIQTHSWCRKQQS